MAEVKLDAEKLNNNVLPKVNNLNVNLDEIKNQLYSIISEDMPFDFEYQEVLRTIPNNIEDIMDGVQEISNWIKETTEKLFETERKNSELLNNIKITSKFNNFTNLNGKAQTGSQITSTAVNKILTTKQSIMGTTVVGKFISKAQNAITGAKDKIKNVGATIVDGASNKFKGIFYGEKNVINKSENAVKVGGNFIHKKWDSAVSMTTKAFQGIKNTGAKVVSTVTSAFPMSKSIGNAVWKATKSVVASKGNVVMALTKGVAELGEALIDIVTIAGAAIGSIGTGVVDGIFYLGDTITGNTDKYESITNQMWKNTMSFVAETHVENSFNKFYKDTIVGRWLDNNSIDVLKSDREVFNVISGIGYTAGLAVITFFTGGVGGAVTAGAAAAGQSVEKEWAENKQNSWLGIQEEYKNGDISKEKYEQYCKIRNMSEDEWNSIIYQHELGNILDEEFNRMKSIRELPNDWRTSDNAANGIGIGVASGIWEGLNWYLGAKVTGIGSKVESKLAASAMRVGADTLIAAADTPYRVVTEALIKGKDIGQVWKENDGWTGFITNTLIGTGMSAFGEFTGLAKEFGDKQKDKRTKKDKEMISKLIDVINTDELSDERVVDFIQTSFENWVEDENPYAEKLMKKLIELKGENFDLNWQVDEGGGCFWNGDSKGLYLSEDCINMIDSGTYAHETGHLLFKLELSEELPKNWDSIIENARLLASTQNSKKMDRVINDFNNHHNILNLNKATLAYEEIIKDNGYKSMDHFIEYWSQIIDQDLKTIGLYDTMESLKKYGFDDNAIKILSEYNVSSQDIVMTYINNNIGKIKEEFNRLELGGSYGAVSDIIDAVYLGTQQDLNGKVLNVTYSHGRKYYEDANLNYMKMGYENGYGEKLNSFHEIIANFTQIKMSGNAKAQKDLRKVFGEEFYSTLEETFNKLIN